ncbi:enoyl-CoA hydratase/isomerase family protein [Candidatus Mycobacterium methanotrophicum]|uniref:Enoyl-CoA hydratase/isomerase family protein n=1 Tax=Candidatus Mycobacterium methanotrophicum TaxID=2943498 RepID=A0ABY4QM80_9MYCO|nr:enoyl-CoA hydratase/isomerase family protein [Candidatus Mycobacterium methanotrophicum]UQX10941.1 enoyl-CoA hydratase/isomerase family protein [Candidatus Mycobacterium methanotrophicum]
MLALVGSPRRGLEAEERQRIMRNVEGPVVLTGAGRCFSAGVDLRALVDGGAEYVEPFVTALSEAFLAVFDHPAPVVAAVNGHAIAGGCVLALCADVRLMSARTIGLTELGVGVPFPVAALEICRFAMGTSVARATLQAKTIDADTALARGWIDAIISNDELIPQAIAMARELGQYSPGCVRGHQASAAPADSRRDRCGCRWTRRYGPVGSPKMLAGASPHLSTRWPATAELADREPLDHPCRTHADRRHTGGARRGA